MTPLRIPACLLMLAAFTLPLRADDISVAFNSPNSFGPSPLMSGAEPAAIAADPVFADSSTWNNLNIAFGVLSTDPSWNNLVSSTGAATGVNLAITGTVLGVDLVPFLSNPDPLRSQFLAWNSNTQSSPITGAGPGESTSIAWSLTGLAPNTTYDMFVYGSVADASRSFDMTIEGTTLAIPTISSTGGQTPGGVLFTSITSDANGTISGVGTGIGSSAGGVNEADWSGFQIAAVPEPSSLVLIGGAALAIIPLRRKKKLQ